MFKLLALLIFGAAIAKQFLTELAAWDYVFIFLAVFAVRPVALALALLGSELGWRERLVAGWFGPKGFASFVYGLMILQAGLKDLALLVGIAVTASIVVFSSTDILVGKWFKTRQPHKRGGDR